MNTTESPAPPPIWKLDDEVLDFTAEFARVNRLEITPQTLLVRDLGIDSLELLEYVMQLEHRFQIAIDGSATKRFFTGGEVTLHDIAIMVFHLWGNGYYPRKIFQRRAPTPTASDPVPFSQLGGAPTPSELAAGPLFASLGTLGDARLYQRKTDGMRCALIPYADALLGSDAPSTSSDEHPMHRAPLSSYLIDAEPVSTTAYARFLNAIGSIPESIRMELCDVADRRKPCFQLERVAGRWRPIEGTQHHPMILVSWHGANAYSLWANRRDWRNYRGTREIPEELRSLDPTKDDACTSLLPTEAQWEHAARKYGSGPEPWAGRHSQGQHYTAATMPMLPVNATAQDRSAGLTHMPGNIWQWCRDFYSPTFYTLPASRSPDPCGSSPTPVRSERGGSWVGPPFLATHTYRRARVPHARGRCLGFRCVSLASDLPRR